MLSLFFNYQSFRYTLYLGFLYFFMNKRNNEIKQITDTPSPSSVNDTQSYDWGQFVEIDCY